MTNLLIHSMSEFSDIIVPALTLAGADTVVEVGAEFGGMTALLAGHCAGRGGKLVSIDPAPQQEYLDWLAAQDSAEHVAATSLEAIPQMSGVDAWVIDGDHNWYTVYNELKQVRDICRRDGRPLLAFMHDIHWPSGRRDQYYAPDRIPEAFRKPYSHDGGARPGEPGLRLHRGFRGMGNFAFAIQEGGPRNGVLTAIEDFIAEELATGTEYMFAEIPGVFGLGVLFDMDAPWSAPLANLLLPLHQNKLLAALEANRLANYLRVIEMQDDEAMRRTHAA